MRDTRHGPAERRGGRESGLRCAVEHRALCQSADGADFWRYGQSTRIPTNIRSRVPTIVGSGTIHRFNVFDRSRYRGAASLRIRLVRRITLSRTRDAPPEGFRGVHSGDGGERVNPLSSPAYSLDTSLDGTGSGGIVDRPDGTDRIGTPPRLREGCGTRVSGGIGRRPPEGSGADSTVDTERTRGNRTSYVGGMMGARSAPRRGR